MVIATSKTNAAAGNADFMGCTLSCGLGTSQSWAISRIEAIKCSFQATDQTQVSLGG
jgi:hypothetical protein